MTKWHITPAVEEARIAKATRDCPTPILGAEECIAKAINDFGDALALGWSGGRCSTAVLYMALKLRPDLKVIFNDTGVEFPETIEFVNEITEKWNVNLTIAKPETNFWAIVKEYGFPMLRGQYHDNSKSKEGRPMCCILLKEKPLEKVMKPLGITAMMTGIRACESRVRTFGIAQYGQAYYAKTLKMWRIHPIAFWNTENLVDFTRVLQISQNKIYGMGHDRCGCWPCTGYITWKKSLAKSHPKMYRMIAKMKGEPTLWEYEDVETCKQWVADEP